MYIHKAQSAQRRYIAQPAHRHCADNVPTQTQIEDLQSPIHKHASMEDSTCMKRIQGTNTDGEITHGDTFRCGFLLSTRALCGQRIHTHNAVSIHTHTQNVE